MYGKLVIFFVGLIITSYCIPLGYDTSVSEDDGSVVNNGQTSQCHDLEDQNLNCGSMTVFILRIEMSGCGDVAVYKYVLTLKWSDQSMREIHS
jgi:hypothetical protein